MLTEDADLTVEAVAGTTNFYAHNPWLKANVAVLPFVMFVVARKPLAIRHAPGDNRLPGGDHDPHCAWPLPAGTTASVETSLADRTHARLKTELAAAPGITIIDRARRTIENSLNADGGLYFKIVEESSTASAS